MLDQPILKIRLENVTGLSRRKFAAAATCGAAGLFSQSAALRAAGALNWDDPAERLRTMVRVMGRTDGGIAIRWIQGVLSGVVEQETKQVLGVSQQIFTRHHIKEDGSCDAVYLEIVYFTDLETGAVLEQWNNPYTGRVVTVPVQILGPTRFFLPLTLKVVNEPYAMEGIVNDHWLEPLPTEGGDVLFNERIDSYVPPMIEGGAPLKFHEVFAFRAPLAALTDTTRPHVPATVDKVNVISWRPWMDMDEVNGVTMSRGAGRVISDYADLPADLAAKNRTFFPDVINDLESYLEL
jgi:hypothetical protein